MIRKGSPAKQDKIFFSYLAFQSMSKDVNKPILYVKQGCPWCIDALAYFKQKEIELEIGGTLIDKQYGAWLEIWAELTQKEEKLIGKVH